MAQVLLLNPKGRTMASKTRRKARKAPSAKQRANWARFAAMARARAGKGKRSARRANPAPRSYSVKRRTSRRRNPINLGGRGRGILGAFMGQVKTAAVQGVGAVAVDFAYGQVSRFLPAMLQRTPGRVGLGDAVKMLFAVALGEALAKPTRGMSRAAATGSLTVQISDIARSFMPAGSLGYYVPAPVVNKNVRVGPNARGPVMLPAPARGNPALSAYTRPGFSPSLSRAQVRDGVTVR